MFRKVIQTLKKDPLQGIQVSIDLDSAPDKVYLTFVLMNVDGDRFSVRCTLYKGKMGKPK